MFISGIGIYRMGRMHMIKPADKSACLQAFPSLIYQSEKSECCHDAHEVGTFESGSADETTVDVGLCEKFLGV